MSTQEPISWFSGENPSMVRAMTMAQSTFGDFITALRTRSDIEESLIKYMFPANDGKAVCEHMFLSDLEIDGDKVYGNLTSTPQHTNLVKEGQRFEVDPELVSDWMYVINGKGTGGYTFRVMWESFSSRDRQGYAPHPPFCWLNLA